MGYGWFNLGSILLGVLALVFPMLALALRHKNNLSTALTHASYFAALITLLFQIIYQNHLAEIGDFGAIRDTSDSLAWVSVQFVIAVCAVHVIVIGIKAYLNRKNP